MHTMPGVRHAFRDGVCDAAAAGQRVVLPASYTNSPRYMHSYFQVCALPSCLLQPRRSCSLVPSQRSPAPHQDVLAIVRTSGRPHSFVDAARAASLNGASASQSSTIFSSAPPSLVQAAAEHGHCRLQLSTSAWQVHLQRPCPRRASAPIGATDAAHAAAADQHTSARAQTAAPGPHAEARGAPTAGQAAGLPTYEGENRKHKGNCGVLACCTSWSLQAADTAACRLTCTRLTESDPVSTLAVRSPQQIAHPPVQQAWVSLSRWKLLQTGLLLSRISTFQHSSKQRQ